MLNIGCLDVTGLDCYMAAENFNDSGKLDCDGLSPFILKNCIGALCEPLKMIFNKSLSTGVFAHRWKLATLSPIFKSGYKNIVSNYRPIAKISNVSEMFEQVVAKQLTFAGRIISPNQPLAQLQKLGFHSSILNWFKSHLDGRNYRVECNVIFSNLYVATSGLPQGSALGPFVFIIFINDLSYCITSSEFLLLADDLKIFRSVNSISDSELLQNDQVKVGNWCSRNKLPLNVFN